MPKCVRCNRLLHSLENTRCISCQQRELEQNIWPTIRSLLANLGGQIQADATWTWIGTWFKNAQSVFLFRLYPPGGAHACVAEEYAEWQHYRESQRRYTKRAQKITLQTECFGLLFSAIYARRLYRRYLRSRFRYDAHRQRFLRAVPHVLPWDAFLRLTSNIHCLNVWSKVIVACLHTIHKAVIDKQDTYSLIPHAVMMMRRGIQLTPPDFLATLMDSSHDVLHEMATLGIGGWEVTQLSLTKNRRLKAALGKDGKSPFTALLERIAAATYQAWSERRPGESLAQLQPRIASLLEDGDASAEPQERLSPESLGKMQQEIAQWSNIASSLEEWTAIQEASQRLDELAARAGLSLREAEVLALMRQGLTQEQIGARLTPPLPRDTVKTYAERIATKMYDAAMK